ncbi:MAG: NPCBM/NEW2 domain-containing protein [Planctomycetia bacterium]|nr:NPCBM/NEW2 domain-containing protein [Planctomycetia bacterium]
MLLATFGGVLPASGPAAADPARVVFLAGGRSHGPGEHEFRAGCMLLARALNEQSGLPVRAEVIQGWPSDPTVLDGAKAVVFYSDATSVVGKGWEKTDELARKGTGLMFMHYAVHPSKADGEKYFLPWMGGTFEDGWSVNPHWVAGLEGLPGHPVSRGVAGPVICLDEFYYNMRFRPNRGEVRDLVTATPSRERMIRYINLWNEHGVAGLGKRQTLMWGVERPDGGRGVGFTGGHYHRNWAVNGFRTLVLNAVVWTAGLEVPAGGVTSQPVSEDDLNANLDDKGPNKPRIKPLTSEEIAALEPAEIPKDREAKFPPPAAAAAPAPAQTQNAGTLWQSGVVTAATPGQAVDFDVDLRGSRKIWLVVEDEGSIDRDWAAWVEPRFVGAGGERAVTDVGWVSATTGWGSVHKDRNALGGPLTVAGRSVKGIGVHATSVIEVNVPQGMTRLVGRAAHDDGGAKQSGGGRMRFSIHAQAPRLVVKAAPATSGPVEPAAGPDTLAVPEGLEATLFAGEPMLSSPSDIDVDARGRVWVCEVMNYRGKQETRKEGDRILVLADTDGDGKADRQTVFHQGRDVDSALGICVIGEGPGRQVIVSCAPDVFVFHDDDGDLKADRRESLFTKVGTPQHDHSAHAFVAGPDGRLYFNVGNTGRAVHDKDGNPIKDRFGNEVNDSGKPFRQGMVFRCRPDGSDFEVLGHNFRNNYEVTIDSYGSLWQSDNDDDGNRGVRINWVMDYGNYGYVDERTGASWHAPRTNLETEIPQRHWHQNDPGVVPNMLLTGRGSPAGICVYEGALLPERYHGALLHCDPGPNVVRSYLVTPARAGYAATMETLVDGSADRWFRPSDVCVAPDGSVIVADWYDPGVGGHGMGDTEKGRIYRIAPKATRWSVPAADFGSLAGAIKALGSPNICTRATALGRIARDADAAAALTRAFEAEKAPRLRARLAWAAGMLPGQTDAWIARLAADEDENLRCVAVRMGRLAGRDVLGLAEKILADPSVAVRRELAISLRGNTDPRADRVWAKLAERHAAGDRWELEALGIGADGGSGLAGPSQWDARLAAWLAISGDAWKTAAGREVVWRSRAATTPRLLAELVADPTVSTAESLALLRAFDFQDRAAATAAIRDIVRGFQAADEKRRVILPELALRLDPADASDDAIRQRIDEAAGYAAGSDRLLELVRRFKLEWRLPDLVALAAAEGTSEQLAAAAAGTVVDGGRRELIMKTVATADSAAARLLVAAGIHGSGQARDFLKGLLADAETPAELKSAAVRGLARSQQGGRDLVAIAKDGKLSKPLEPVAALAIAACPWQDVKKAAADVLPLPKAKGGGQLPPVVDLVARNGSVDRGKAVFTGAGTCAKCHVVGSEGKSVGPNLSGIGAKLSRPALYESILAPSAAISHNYETWVAQLADGRIVSGLLISRTPDEVVIRGPDGIDVKAAAKDVEELVKQPVSLMPADLAATLTADELVDLIAWLETLKAAN